jgi:hypothetical protein
MLLASHIAACADDVAQEAIVPLLPPKICFQLLKEKDARKKLQDLGLSSVGEKNVRLPLPVTDQLLHYFTNSVLGHASVVNGDFCSCEV